MIPSMKSLNVCGQSLSDVFLKQEPPLPEGEGGVSGYDIASNSNTLTPHPPNKFGDFSLREKWKCFIFSATTL
jgi:hypothetical protein